MLSMPRPFQIGDLATPAEDAAHRREVAEFHRIAQPGDRERRPHKP
jgi:hypothetical protein